MLAGPTVAYPAPAGGPAVRHARGRASRVASRAPTTSPGIPAVSLPCGIAEGDAARRPAARGRRRRGRAAAVRRARLRGGRRDEGRGLQLDAARGVPASATTGSCCRSARSSSTATSRSGSTRSSPSASSVEAAEPLGVPVLPSLPVRADAVLRRLPGQPDAARRDLPARCCATCSTRSYGQGFRRFLFVNGHGGNDAGPATPSRRGRPSTPDAQVLWHNWWSGPRTRAVVDSIDPDASHASWFENFPWTRLAGVDAAARSASRWPTSRRMREPDPADVRELLGDGSLGGLYERPDEDVLRVWQAGVEEVRELIESGWRDGLTSADGSRSSPARPTGSAPAIARGARGARRRRPRRATATPSTSPTRAQVDALRRRGRPRRHPGQQRRRRRRAGRPAARGGVRRRLARGRRREPDEHVRLHARRRRRA